MRLGGSLALLCAATLAWSAPAPDPTPFSGAPPGAVLPAGWRVLVLPRQKGPEFSIVRDEGQSVLRVFSAAAVGSVAVDLLAQTATAPILTWRWKIDHVIGKARLGTKEGDDFAARVYVSFDVPLDQLSFGERTKLRIARLVFGPDLPTAAICYVWDNTHAIGTSVWNPYSDRLRMVVLQSGGARAGQWVTEARDVEADFRAAFGSRHPGPVPRITGIAAAADTDQTLETVTAWFGDFVFGPR